MSAILQNICYRPSARILCKKRNGNSDD